MRFLSNYHKHSKLVEYNINECQVFVSLFYGALAKTDYKLPYINTTIKILLKFTCVPFYNILAVLRWLVVFYVSFLILMITIEKFIFHIISCLTMTNCKSIETYSDILNQLYIWDVLLKVTPLYGCFSLF